MGNDSFAAIQLSRQCFFSDELRDIDLLRQLGRFKEAKQRIRAAYQQEYQSTVEDFEQFLRIESILVTMRITKRY